MGDPTTFVSRDNEHFELYNNVLIDRGVHRYKFGGYLFHLRFRPSNPDTARGAFAYTGQWTGNALADFLTGVENGSPSQPDFRNALQTQKVCDAVIDSANTGNWMETKVEI